MGGWGTLTHRGTCRLSLQKGPPVNEVARPMPRPPAHVAPYVAALGAETAVLFLLHFGGPKLYIGTNPRDSNLVAKLFGQNAVVALAQSPALTNSKVKVPVANR